MLRQKDFLLSGFLTRSYSRNKISHILHFLLIVLSILMPVRPHIVKRAPTCDSATSPEVQIDVLFCNPKVNDTAIYEIGQIVNLSWNPSNNLLFGANSNAEVEVYLFRQWQNNSAIVDTVMFEPGKSYFLAQRAKNSINFIIGFEWFPPNYSYSLPSITYFYFRVMPKDSGPEIEADPRYSSPSFKVQTKLESNPTIPQSSPNTTVLSSVPSTSSSIVSEDKSENNAFIAVASVAAFLAFIAIVIAIKSRKHNNQTKQQSLSNLSANSSTPMITPLPIGKFGQNNRDIESPAEAESIHSTTPLASKEEMRSKQKSTVSFSNENQPISASDAALLSDAFRKVLRKPDWKPEDDDDDDTNLSKEERLRRKEAKELMKKELAEEGTDLQNISTRHTRVEIRNTSDEIEKGDTIHSPESGPK